MTARLSAFDRCICHDCTFASSAGCIKFKPGDWSCRLKYKEYRSEYGRAYNRTLSLPYCGSLSRVWNPLILNIYMDMSNIWFWNTVKQLLWHACKFAASLHHSQFRSQKVRRFKSQCLRHDRLILDFLTGDLLKPSQACANGHEIHFTFLHAHLSS